VKNAVAIAVAMNVTVETMLAGEANALPLMPCPDVHPLATFAP
jgi:hypothetical protein